MASKDEENGTEIENGIAIIIPKGLRPGEKMKYYNPMLQLLREAVLCTLDIEVSQAEKYLQCLDAFSGSGITCIQWKQRFKESVYVVAADRYNDGVKVNCHGNKLQYLPWDHSASQTPGQLPEVPQEKDQIHGCSLSANIILHQECFNFVFMQPNGNMAPYLDSLFTNVRNNGVVSFLSPNIASQCFRSPKLMQRLYGAHVQKTDYVKELAVRVLLSAIAKAAATHDRSIDVLYCVSAEDHFLIVVRVTKKSQAAIDCVAKCRHVLHCRMCEERTVLPETNAPIEQPYRLLPCECKAKNPGKTAVLIGPVWVGSIFSVDYLSKLVKKTRETFPHSKVIPLLDSVLLEAKCQAAEGLSVTSRNSDMISMKRRLSQSNQGENCKDVERESKKIKQEEHAENGSDLRDVDSDTKGDNGRNTDRKENTDETTNTVRERGNAGVDTGSSAAIDGLKETRGQTDSGEEPIYSDSPVFYYNINRQRYKNVPKIDKLVTVLRQAGYRASRTHFEHNCVRTSATGNQIQTVVDENRAEKGISASCQ